MQRNPHRYQIATGYRTFYSLSLIYQPITKKRLFFHKKGSNDVLVKVLLNEKEAKLPVKTDVAPYYHWKDVESYYREKLDKYQHI